MYTFNYCLFLISLLSSNYLFIFELKMTYESEIIFRNLFSKVYLDNLSMELYNGRLDKTPGAIALRHRWYGTGTPELGTFTTVKIRLLSKKNRKFYDTFVISEKKNFHPNKLTFRINYHFYDFLLLSC